MAGYKQNKKNAVSSYDPKGIAIADCLLKGLSNQETAKNLNVTIRTIENYLTNMFEKSFTSSRTELINKLLGKE